MVALIAVSGFFVAAEVALVLVDRRSPGSSADGRLADQLAGAQLGVTTASLALGLLVGHLVATSVERSGAVVVVVAGAAALVATALAQLVFGELVPRLVASARPETTALRLAPALRLATAVIGPLVGLVGATARRVTGLLGLEPASGRSPARTTSEFEVLFRTAAERGELGRSVAELLDRSLRLARRTAAEVLVPRTSVVGLPTEASVADLVAVSRRSGHSRFVVYGTDLDDPRGVVHVKAAYGIERSQWGAVGVGEVMGELLAVPESRDLDDLLADLRATGHDLVVVLDEHGGTAGIVTLEDVLEQVVGSITDEHDRWQVGLTHSVAPGEWVLDGGAHPDLVAGETGLVLPDGPYETLAGFMLDRLGRIPDVGDAVDERGWQLRVDAMDRRRVARVRVVAP